MTVFVRDPDDPDTWRRDDERHENVLLDTSRIPARLAELGIDAEVTDRFGTEPVTVGLNVVVGVKRPLAV